MFSYRTHLFNAKCRSALIRIERFPAELTCGMWSQCVKNEHHRCNDTYFKCPGFYCTPLRFVCDDRFHCPGGMEEKYCERTSCSGLFRCYKAADSKTNIICIHPSSICDKQLDCLYGDDEYFCDYDFPTCPINCTCLLFSIVCNRATGFEWNEMYPYVSVNISKSTIMNMSIFLTSLNQIYNISLMINS